MVKHKQIHEVVGGNGKVTEIEIEVNEDGMPILNENDLVFIDDKNKAKTRLFKKLGAFVLFERMGEAHQRLDIMKKMLWGMQGKCTNCGHDPKGSTLKKEGTNNECNESQEDVLEESDSAASREMKGR